VIGTGAVSPGPDRFESRGGELSYLDVGEGPAVLMLHDAATSSEVWLPFLPLFQGRFRVIAPNLPDAGRSGDPAGTGSTMDVWANHVRELVDHLEVERYAVVGHGLGGGIARSLALGDGRVDAMVLLSATVDDDRLANDLREALGAIAFPVLILWGEDDRVSPPSVAEALNDAMPSSTLGLLPGCGHDLLGEAPETIGPMIAEYLRARFLREPHGHDQKEGVVLLQLERRPPWVGSPGGWAEDEADDWYVDDEED
jgi:pimeloyl-ACP methyl ester carboxylesterase